MSKQTLMHLAVFEPEKLNAIKLSKHEPALIQLVYENGPLDCTDVALEYGISVHSASTRLKRVYILGYLQRESHTLKTNATIYQYTCNPELW